MAKRFTDTEKWRDEWWGSLPNDYRMIWLYLVDSCSIAGIWKKDFRGLNFNCNTKITESEFLEVFSSRVIDKGNFFFIPKFLRFQCPKGLNSKKPAIVSIIKELQLNNLIETVNESLGNDFLIIKGKGEGKGKDKVKEREKENEEFEEKDFNEPDIDGDTIIFPLDTKPVRQLWATWKKYRWEQYRARYKLMGEQSDLKRLEGMAFSDIEKTILTAIANNWKNLYPEKNGTSKAKPGGERQQRNAATIEYLKNHYGNKSGQ